VSFTRSKPARARWSDSDHDQTIRAATDRTGRTRVDRQRDPCSADIGPGASRVAGDRGHTRPADEAPFQVRFLVSLGANMSDFWARPEAAAVARSAPALDCA
jgi:hypothetical protein